MRRGLKRTAIGAAGVAVVAAGVAVVTMTTGANAGSGGADASPPSEPRKTAPVERRDLVQTEKVDGRLGYGDRFGVLASSGGTLTGLPANGQTIERGQALWEVDGTPGPILLYGGRPMYRDLAAGVDDGPDVRQLEENLVALGYATTSNLTVDDTYTSATAAAVERWQEALGLEETGRVERSRVVFLLGPARVAERKAALGAEATGEVLSVTGTTQQVEIDLETDLAPLVATGDDVDVELPDGTIVPGTVTSVGTVVETNQDEMGGTTTTLPVTVSLPAGTTALDVAPVDVELVRSKDEDALAVPVASLLALAEGGYAVERVQADGTTELVAVELGDFADGYVAVSGNVGEGDEVVVA